MRILQRSPRAHLAAGVSLAVFVVSATIVFSRPSDPQPEDATVAILTAFDRYDVVGVSAGHNEKDLDEYLLTLVQRPELASKVNDIAVECGNSRYQTILDRYIAGEDVPIAEASQVWRNTSVPMCAISGFYRELFPRVRAINKTLPAGKRFRMLALEPPVDWSAGDPATVLRNAGDRNATITSVLMTEVLAKRRKALVLCGVGHLFHTDGSRGTAVSDYERTYPARTFVITTHNGFAAFIDLDRGRQLEARMRSWPRPSIVRIKGTWLSDLDLPYFMWPFPRRMAGEAIADKVDAYLYLGPGDSLSWEPIPAAILDDAAHITELVRRFHVNVDALRRRNEVTTLFTAADRQEARQFAPGAELVGTYSRTAGEPAVVEVEFRAGRVSAKLSSGPEWGALENDGAPLRYRTNVLPTSARLEFEMENGAVNGLMLEPGAGDPKVHFVRIH